MQVKTILCFMCLDLEQYWILLSIWIMFSNLWMLNNISLYKCIEMNKCLCVICGATMP